MEEIISQATKNNWKKLNVNEKDRLTSRANKRMSMKKIIPFEYMSHKEAVNKMLDLLDKIKLNNWKKEDSIYSVAINLIHRLEIQNQENVKEFLKEYSNLKVIEELVKYDIDTMKEEDLLGLLYQCLMREGEKNQKGSYYTPRAVTEKMTKDLDFSNAQTFLDPCCGSGAFLLSLKDVQPEQIYGIDIDAIAVMIAKINLILKYKGIEFKPQIYHDNFLRTNPNEKKEWERHFNYIVTNPPWGAMTDKKDIPPEITSGEIFSCFLVRAFEKLEKRGTLRFLLPISVLNVKTHRDVREYILEKGNLSKITLYDESFTGVTTKYVDLEVENKKAEEQIIIQTKDHIQKGNKDNFKLTSNKVFTIINSQHREIIEKVKQNAKYYLDNSIWALGIVTGDNKNKLLDEPKEGYEAIYTGKDINPYKLKSPKKYVKYDRNSLQQVAKEEYYRAPEKLVYKFISNQLVFAYDDRKSLFLNSANILIPNIPNMSIKTTMAYLNSELFSYYYRSLFGEIKILKGNLMEIPFPDITEEENKKISELVDEIRSKNANDDVLQKEIYKTYHLEDSEINYIKGTINPCKN